MAGSVEIERVARGTLRRVTFTFDASRKPDARCVGLAGSFNQWNAAAHQLRRAPDGSWHVSVWLTPGTYPYLFLVDGFPYNDPADDGRIPCEWGGQYSVRRVA